MNDSLNCTEIRALLALYVGDDLDAAESARVARHLADCGLCRGEQTRWVESRSRLATLRQTTTFSGPSVWSDVRAELVREGRIEPVRRIALRRFSWAPLAAAAAVVVAVGLFTLLRGAGEDGSPLGGAVAQPTAAPGDAPVQLANQTPVAETTNVAQPAGSPLRKAGAGDRALIYDAESIDELFLRARRASSNNPALDLAGDEQLR
jgi:anti-sigma factor RsiW